MKRSTGETHVLDLTRGWDEIWKSNFDSKVRNQCRAAIKKGVETFEATRRWTSLRRITKFTSKIARAGAMTRRLIRARCSANCADCDGKTARPACNYNWRARRGEIVAGVLLFHGQEQRFILERWHETRVFGAFAQ